MNSDTGGKSKHDFSDIMSILGEEEKHKKPVETAAAKKHEHAAKRDDAFAKKLMADIEQKNAEILKLNSDNMALKYSMSEKDMEIKRLQGQADSLREQTESLQAQVLALNQQMEDLNKFASDARLKLGEMDADKAKLMSRIGKKDEAEAPVEEDVATIFKRIALNKDEAEAQKEGEPAVPDPDKQKLKKSLSTAKLYDL